MGNQLITGVLRAGLRQLVVALALFALPFGGSGVHGDHEIPAGFVASLLHSLQNGFDGLVIAGQVGGEAALITNGSCQTTALQDGSQGVEDFSAPAQGFLEGKSTYGHDHEFLGVHGVGGMSTTVQDVHHGHRQAIAGNAAQEAVQRNIQGSSGSTGAGNGHGQNGVGTQLALVLGAVGSQHSGVYRINVRSIHAAQHFANGGVDIFNGLGDALAQVAALVAVTKLQCFEFAGGCAAGCHTPADGAVIQSYLSFNGGIAPGIQNLPTFNVYDFQIHRIHSFC